MHFITRLFHSSLSAVFFLSFLLILVCLLCSNFVYFISQCCVRVSTFSAEGGEAGMGEGLSVYWTGWHGSGYGIAWYDMMGIA